MADLSDTRDARLRQTAADVRALIDDAEARGERDIASVMRQAADMIVRAVMREAIIEAVAASGLMKFDGRLRQCMECGERGWLDKLTVG